VATAEVESRQGNASQSPQVLQTPPSWRHQLLVWPLSALKHVVYPPLCLVCDVDLDCPNEHFCPACIEELIAFGPACPHCAASVGPFADTSDGCLDCRGQRHRFDGAIRLGIYSGKLRDLCLSFKSVRNELIGPALGNIFDRFRGEELRRVVPDVVVAVPLHFMRRFVRGFNQAESLARYLAHVLKVPHRSRILKRFRRTLPQSQLKRDERHENVSGAFRARTAADLKGATVLLVDDILTTGATCSEAARALKDAGAKRVVVAVIGRSQEHPGG